MDEFLPQIVTYASAVMIAFSVVQFLTLFSFVFLHEILQHRKPLSLTEIFTPFTLLLLVMIVCQIGQYASEMILVKHRQDKTTNTYILTFSFQNFCSIAYEASYIYYSYLRAEPILGQVFNSIAWHVSIAVKASPFLLLIQFTFFPLSGIQFEDPQLSKNLVLIGNCIGMLNGLLIVTFDILCVITFVRYLKSTQVEEGDVDERFLIISRYGIAPPVLCIVGLGLYLYYSVVAESEVLLFCIYLLFTAVFLILFRMKVALHREKVAKENKRRSRIESVQSTATNGGRGGEGSSIRNVAATNSAPDMQTSRSFTKIGNIGKRQ